MQPTYYAAPAGRCFAPAKWFGDEQKALEFARGAADAFQVGYTVWRILAGRPKRLAAYSADGTEQPTNHDAGNLAIQARPSPVANAADSGSR